MRGVILAAGRGGRLSGVAGDRPKCLARVGDRTLIERQLRALRTAGVDDVTVVIGYRGDEVQSACGAGVEFVVNEAYATTNSLYSLWLARHALADGFVVMNCDVLFHPQLLDDLLSSRYDDALLVSAADEARPFGDEEMKVRIRKGRVSAIAKTLDASEADAENVGIAKFGADGARALVDACERLVAAGATREWLPRAFGAVAEQRPLYVVESRGFPWIEIDYPEDYWRACAEVLPAIEAIEARRLSADAHAPAGAAVRARRTAHHV